MKTMAVKTSRKGGSLLVYIATILNQTAKDNLEKCMNNYKNIVSTLGAMKTASLTIIICLFSYSIKAQHEHHMMHNSMHSQQMTDTMQMNGMDVTNII
jgi:hypothetical protein